jgi:prepilin-type N-terminal cleavage/methylation domain-containing protein
MYTRKANVQPLMAHFTETGNAMVRIREYGFTLTELLRVLFIVAILTSLVAPVVANSIQYARESTTTPFPVKQPQAIIGHSAVASTSNRSPIKLSGFPQDLEKFENVKSYAECVFVYVPPTEATPQSFGTTPNSIVPPVPHAN